MQKGYNSNKCRIKHFAVPNGRYAWVPILKYPVFNLIGPKISFLDHNVIVFCLAGYFKIKKVFLDVQELIYSPNFWYPSKFYDLKGV